MARNAVRGVSVLVGALGVLVISCCGIMSSFMPKPNANEPTATTASSSLQSSMEVSSDTAPVLAEVDSSSIEQASLMAGNAESEKVTLASPEIPNSQTSAPPASDLDLEELSPKVPASREWNAKTGGYRVQAVFVGLKDGTVHLKKESGENAKVPLDKLSNADTDYVADLIRVHPKARVVIGKVGAVFNGNSLQLHSGDASRKVHLFGIAPPVAGQPFYAEAKAALTNKCAGEFVWFEWTDKDKDGNPSGILYLDGRNMNLEMVAEGYAWHNTSTTSNVRLARAQVVAQGRHLGLWSDEAPVAPWQYSPY